MRIKLDDTHYLNNDSRCYWITAIVTPKEGSKKRSPMKCVLVAIKHRLNVLSKATSKARLTLAMQQT